MPSANLDDENIEIRLFDADLIDAGEVRNLTAWKHTLNLNALSSWQLDMRSEDFDLTGITPKTTVMFLRNGEPLIDGPIVPNGIQHTCSAAAGETTTVLGTDDTRYLMGRDCYPVTTGALFDESTGFYKFGKLRSAIGIKSIITKGDATYEEYDIPLVVEDSSGFQAGNTVALYTTDGNRYANWYNVPGAKFADGSSAVFTSTLITLAGVDLSTNTLTLTVPQQAQGGGQPLAPPIPAGWTVYQTSGGIVDDPSYAGYDVRTGPADVIAKELVYYNAGPGACTDIYSSRTWPHLVVAAPTGHGIEITANSRGEGLLTQVSNICLSGGINFQTTMQDPYKQEIVFDTFSGSDLSNDGNLEFSIENGSLSDYKYTYGAPTANFVWIYGPGTGPDKQMLPLADVNSIKQYGRWEGWVGATSAAAGATSADINANMLQTGNQTLASSVQNAQLTMSINETELIKYPDDFQLGDKVRVRVGTGKRSTTVNEIITSLTYMYPAGATGSGSGSALSALLSGQQMRTMELAIENRNLIKQLYTR